MRITSQKNFTIATSSLLAVLAGGISSIGFFIENSDLWKWIIIEALLIFILSYLIIFYFVKIVVRDKLNPLYKIIQQVVNQDDDKFDAIEDKDFVEEAGKDVAIWAKQKTREIDKLKRLEKYRREFLGDVSHELKTPIFNVQGYVSTLLDGGLEDKNINRKYLERADQSINRLISIVQDLESISKLESGELEIHKEDLNLFQVIKEVVEMHEMRALQKKIRIQLIQPEDNYMVYADKTRIAEVLNNLIVNSIVYGKECGKTTIQIFDMEDKVLVEIADNGIGIEEKHIPRLFERFFRVDKSRSSEKGGTGLGLSIVKHILEVHNQSIHVKSKLGEGSSFTFTLDKSKCKS